MAVVSTTFDTTNDEETGEMTVVLSSVPEEARDECGATEAATAAWRSGGISVRMS